MLKIFHESTPNEWDTSKREKEIQTRFPYTGKDSICYVIVMCEGKILFSSYILALFGSRDLEATTLSSGVENISQASAPNEWKISQREKEIQTHFTYAAKDAIYYVIIATRIFSCVKIAFYFHLFSFCKCSC